jgi:hypothetical protein
MRMLEQGRSGGFGELHLIALFFDPSTHINSPAFSGRLDGRDYPYSHEEDEDTERD